MITWTLQGHYGLALLASSSVSGGVLKPLRGKHPAPKGKPLAVSGVSGHWGTPKPSLAETYYYVYMYYVLKSV